MDKSQLERLRQLAGTKTVVKTPAELPNKNMYQIKEMLTEASDEERARYDAADGTGKKVTVAKAPWEKDDKDDVKEADDEELDETALDLSMKNAGPMKDIFSDPKDKNKKDDKKEPTNEQEQMREWSNSVYQQYEDRGHVMDQPEGETVDLSLRRYLNADPMKVSLEEDVISDKLIEEYNKFKKDKK